MPSTDNPAQQSGLPIEDAVHVGEAGEGLELESDSSLQSTQQREQFAPPQARQPSQTKQDGILLEVVHADSGAPAAGAKVFLMDMGSRYWDGPMREIPKVPLWETHWFDLAQRFGLEFTTDEAGQIRLPKASRSGLLYVSLEPRLSAQGSLRDAKNGQLRLELYPITEILVRVRQAQGGPIANEEMLLMGRTRAGSRTSARGVTNLQGIARIQLPSSAIAYGLDAWDKFTATLLSQFHNYGRRQQVERSADPEHIHDLVVEAGSIEVLLPPGLELGDEVANLQVQRLGQRVIANRIVLSRVTRFDNAPLGERFLAQLSIEEGNRQYVAEGAGPKHSGESVTFQLQSWEGPPTLSLRILDATGVPFSNSELRMTREGRRWSERGVDLTSDAEGRVKIVLKVANLNQAHKLTLELEKKGNAFSAVLDLPGNYQPGSTELGDVVLRPPPVVVSGRVLRSDGEPVHGASIFVEGFGEQDGHRRIEFQDSCMSQGDGSFILRNHREAPRALLRVYRNGWALLEPLEAAFGQEGIELIMHPSGSIECRVLTDIPVEQGPLFQLQAEDESLLMRTLKLDPEAIGDGTWILQAENLTPTSYRLRILDRRIGVPMESIGPIVVPSGGQAEIEPIDLRGRLRRLTLTVVDENNEAPERVHVKVMREGHGESTSAMADGFGQFHLLHWGEPIRVSVEVMGVGYAFIDDFNRSQVLQLVPLRRRIRIASDLSFLTGGYQVQMTIRARSSKDRLAPSWRGKEFKFGAKPQVLDLQLPSNMDLEISWSIGVSGKGSTAIGISYLDPGSVDGARLSLDIPADILGGMKNYLENNR